MLGKQTKGRRVAVVRVATVKAEGGHSGVGGAGKALDRALGWWRGFRRRGSLPNPSLASQATVSKVPPSTLQSPWL